MNLSEIATYYLMLRSRARHCSGGKNFKAGQHKCSHWQIEMSASFAIAYYLILRVLMALVDGIYLAVTKCHTSGSLSYTH